MLIRPSANIQQNYNVKVALCKETGEPVYLTNNGEGDFVVMDIKSFTRKQKMLDLRERLIAVEEERMYGNVGVSVDDLDKELKMIINEV